MILLPLPPLYWVGHQCLYYLHIWIIPATFQALNSHMRANPNTTRQDISITQLMFIHSMAFCVFNPTTHFVVVLANKVFLVSCMTDLHLEPPRHFTLTPLYRQKKKKSYSSESHGNLPQITQPGNGGAQRRQVSLTYLSPSCKA